jgi:D-alanyl-D-alanine carboxypeptidase/D-alanyl-D-alanine-endopeptidase (penicillin-binding protein 4)
MTGRWGLCLAMLALAACGGGGGARTRSTPVTEAGLPAVPDQPTAVHRSGPPGAARLRAALTRILRPAGPGSGASVYDLQHRATIVSLRDATKRPPASLEKLWTTVALLRKLGPDARLHTTVLGTGQLGARGVWHGNLYLKGGGDPTLGDGHFNKVWLRGYGPTAAQLVAQLRDDGIRRVTGKLIGDASLFDAMRGGPSSGGAPDIPDFGGELSALTYDHGGSLGLTPGAFAAKELALALKSARIIATPAKLTNTAPRHARRLAIVSSPPLSVLIRLMDVPSDDLFAEMLTKQLGARFAHAGTTKAGAQVITKVIHSFNLHPTIVDGSGLSRADRASPLEVVDLLRYVWRTPLGDRLTASLPVVGLEGTVRRIGAGTAAQGHCVAKTGTLNNVTNLAGYCHAKGHRAVAFALFIDGPSNEKALTILTKAIAAIARL